MKNLLYPILLAVLSTMIFFSCGGKTTSAEVSQTNPEKTDLLELARENFESLDLTKRPDKDHPKVVLGKVLFFDPQLSETGEVSCNSCHDLKKFGVDNKPLSKGIKGHMTQRNSPTILNTSGQVAQFWDGRSATLREQVRMPIMNLTEMGMTEAMLVDRLKKSPDYQKRFELAFPGEEILIENMADAIASFIESEVYHSKFDKFLLGQVNLSKVELKGMQVFIEKGCTDCHDGALFGGDDFEKFGLFQDYWAMTKSHKPDSGRFLITGDPDDLYVFKIPTLRNIDKTQPYFHDGSVRDLKEAVKVMGKVQLNVDLSNDETEAIVQFLATLTGDHSTI
ncbi:MAG: cytochrome c peroxidase [Cytophagales bacterium]|nr:cytochrome c peroxidase [Cytophagales bacterium]